MTLSVRHEILDVVDIDDRVIDKKTRGEIHQRGLMHRAVHVLVFNLKNELFIQKRSMQKDENPGLWDTSSAGHVDSGESYLECAVRELHEELGITVDSDPDFLFHLPPTPQNGMEHSHVYRYVHDGELVLQQEEIDAGKWLSKLQVDLLVDDKRSQLTDVLRSIWREYLHL